MSHPAGPGHTRCAWADADALVDLGSSGLTVDYVAVEQFHDSEV